MEGWRDGGREGGIIPPGSIPPFHLLHIFHPKHVAILFLKIFRPLRRGKMQLEIKLRNFEVKHFTNTLRAFSLKVPDLKPTEGTISFLEYFSLFIRFYWRAPAHGRRSVKKEGKKGGVAPSDIVNFYCFLSWTHARSREQKGE